MIETCFEDLSHALRVFGEHAFRFPQLATIDPDEAVGNLDSGFNGIINAFHSLYDAYRRGGGDDWYAKNEYLAIAAIRNARHHNNANKIRQLFHLHWPDGQPKDRILLLRPKPGEEGASCHEYYLSLDDFHQLLIQGKNQNRLPGDARPRIEAYLQWRAIQAIATQQKIGPKNIFYNAIPLVVNAGIAVFPDISTAVPGKSTESRTFKALFESTPPSRMGDIEYDVLISRAAPQG